MVVGWWACWLTGWLVGELFAWLVGWLTGWLAGCFAGWFAGLNFLPPVFSDCCVPRRFLFEFDDSLAARLVGLKAFTLRDYP